MKGYRRIWIMVAVFFLLSACGGGRVPTPKTAQSVTQSFFQSYGKKYKTSPFAHKNIARIEINGIEETSYRYAQVDTFVILKAGQMIRALVKMRRQFPGGWHVQSWEILDRQ